MAAGLVLVPVLLLGVTQVAVAQEASVSGTAAPLPPPPRRTTGPPEPSDPSATTPVSSVLPSVVDAPSSPAPAPPDSEVEPAGDSASPTDPLLRLVQLAVGGALLLGVVGGVGLYLTREHKGAKP